MSLQGIYETGAFKCFKFYLFCCCFTAIYRGKHLAAYFHNQIAARALPSPVILDICVSVTLEIYRTLIAFPRNLISSHVLISDICNCA